MSRFSLLALILVSATKSEQLRLIQTTKTRRTRRKAEEISAKIFFVFFVSSWFDHLSMTVARVEPVPMLRPHGRRVLRSDDRLPVRPDGRLEARFGPMRERRAGRPS